MDKELRQIMRQLDHTEALNIILDIISEEVETILEDKDLTDKMKFQKDINQIKLKLIKRFPY